MRLSMCSKKLPLFILFATANGILFASEPFEFKVSCSTRPTKWDGTRGFCDQEDCYRAPGTAVIDKSSIQIIVESQAGSQENRHTMRFIDETVTGEYQGQTVPINITKEVCVTAHAASNHDSFAPRGWQNLIVRGRVTAR